MLKWLTNPRLNYFDVIWLAVFINLSRDGLYWWSAGVVVGGAVISARLEQWANKK